MENGIHNGLVKGSSKGSYDGLSGGYLNSLTNRWNSINPNDIDDPRYKPVFYVNADNCATSNNQATILYNQIDKSANDIFPPYENIFTQAGTTYTPFVVKGGLGGKNYLDFATNSTYYMLSANVAASPMYYSVTSPNIGSGRGFTYMMVVKRKPGATYTLLDARDSNSLPTPNDLLLEVNGEGRITFDVGGGTAGSVTRLAGTAGVNLLNDWSIVTAKHQLRFDGGLYPDTQATIGNKFYGRPIDSRVGSNTCALDIYVNGNEQPKIITTSTYTNADFNNDGSYRMFDRQIAIGNKASTYATSGTHIAMVLMIPSYISRALQTRLENYFRYYYNRPF